MTDNIFKPKDFADILPWNMLERHVDCGNCSACCYQLVLLTENDVRAIYDTEELAPGMFFLKRTVNGACIYLKDNKCSIHNRRPQVCRAFDCGLFYKYVKKSQKNTMKKFGDEHDKQILVEGKKRAKQEDDKNA